MIIHITYTHTHKQKFESKIVTRDKEGHHMIIHITHTHTHTNTHTHRKTFSFPALSHRGGMAVGLKESCD